MSGSRVCAPKQDTIKFIPLKKTDIKWDHFHKDIFVYQIAMNWKDKPLIERTTCYTEDVSWHFMAEKITNS